MATKCEEASSSHQNILGFSVPEMPLKLLKPLDDVLRCRLCDEYFNDCMVTNCNHNYCSLCIRRSMSFKAQCPICFQPAFEPELRNNRLIDEIIRTYTKFREAFLNQSRTEEISVTDPHITRVKKEDISDDSQCSSKDHEKTLLADDDKVSCPVCYKRVPEDRINIHLDSCLKRKKEERESEKKTLPKLVYHLLSDKDIRKKLKDHGLNSSGGRQTIIKRHRNFVIMFNANFDSLEPKPVEELVREIEIQELEERLNSCPTQISVNKKSDASDIENELDSYAKQHQSQFNNLINDIQLRQLNRTVVKEPSDSTQTDRTVVKQEPPDDTQKDEKESSSNTKCCRTSNEETSIYNQVSSSGSENSDGLDSPSLLDDLETSKVVQINLLRKRKKGRVVRGSIESPKKK